MTHIKKIPLASSFWHRSFLRVYKGPEIKPFANCWISERMIEQDSNPDSIHSPVTKPRCTWPFMPPMMLPPLLTLFQTVRLEGSGSSAGFRSLVGLRSQPSHLQNVWLLENDLPSLQLPLFSLPLKRESMDKIDSRAGSSPPFLVTEPSVVHFPWTRSHWGYRFPFSASLSAGSSHMTKFCPIGYKQKGHA